MLGLCLALLLAASRQQNQDVHSYANYAEITTQQVDLDILVDFDNHKLHGNTTLTMKTQTKLDTVYLDIWDIAVEKVYYDDKEIPSSQIKVVNKPMGQQLSVQLSTKQIARDVTVRVKIQYSTTNYDTDQNRALTFLAKEQTHSKTQPMFFTSCSPNYCRQISPLQDTQYVRAKVHAYISVPEGVDVFMSANKTGRTISPYYDNYNRYEFLLDAPLVSSNLIAFVAGDFKEEKTYTMPDCITYVIAETQDVEVYRDIVENINQYMSFMNDYMKNNVWGQFRFVVLPDVYPLKANFNPLLTLVSSNYLINDTERSGNAAIIHEMAHSWFGGYLSSQGWTDNWFSAGFSTYLERMAYDYIANAEYAAQQDWMGNYNMRQQIKFYGAQSNFTKIRPYLDNVEPISMLTEIQGEKTYQFLMYLESFIGDDGVQSFITQLIDNNLYPKTQITYTVFLVNLDSWLNENIPELAPEIIDKLNISAWFNQPGYPPIQFQQADSSQINFARTLASLFLQYGGSAKPVYYNNLTRLYANAQIAFIDYLIEFRDDVSTKLIKLLDNTYNFSKSGNLKIQAKWLSFCILTNYSKFNTQIDQFLLGHSNVDILRPIYQAYVLNNQKALAVEKYNNSQKNYHNIAKVILKKMLDISV